MINFLGTRHHFIETTIPKFLFCEDDNITVCLGSPGDQRQFESASGLLSVHRMVITFP